MQDFILVLTVRWGFLSTEKDFIRKLMWLAILFFLLHTLALSCRFADWSWCKFFCFGFFSSSFSFFHKNSCFQINFLFVSNVGFPVLSLFKTISFQSIKDWIFGFFHNILLCCKSCRNGYSDKPHCLPKICPI